MKKVNKTVIFSMLLLIVLSGCWDNKDIDKRVLPLVIGIAKGDNHDYEVTVQIPITKSSGLMSRIVTSKAQTVSRALGEIQTNSENAVDYSQVRLVVIQRNLASNPKELKQLIKFLMTSKEIPLNAQLAFTNESTVKLLSNINNKLGVDATSLFDYFNKGVGWAPGISNTRIWEAYRSLYSYTDDLTIPVVDSGKDTVLIYKGAAALKKGRLTQTVNLDENQLINLFKNHNADGKIENVDFASVMVKRSTIRNQALIEGNTPTVTTDLKLKIDILEVHSGITNDQIKHKLEKLIEKRFYHVFNQSKKNETDLFGFGQYYRGQIPYADLKNWRTTYYPNLKVNFHAQVSSE
ncbi:Ger(x)C family spore germination protein [Pullulanibacillus sp. KACC 23026]|uniref:Ger(x)C family spore germination protein n=1 Tax=Pullulanibacillus sp. KACC 23026 TaxID=3028315 RepID=UPI0023B06F92|nr:Ger(x)C family spore germination protein [Pullulanibacillus sp. KACC 23026]WEG13482.1 Ger(x)C family spore germination protein [Pullulanibacillus sp. KACC 23026]